MDRSRFTTEALISHWEERRALKNLMGKYINCLALNREAEIFAHFWTQGRDDVSLGLNDGIYRGHAAVQGYYSALHNKNLLVSRLIRHRLPEYFASTESREIDGLGTFRIKSISSPVIELASDGATAKGLWCCLGSCAEVETSGPVSYWVSGYYAVDFIKTPDGWKIWHMLSLADICHPCGQDWSKPAIPFSPLPEFAALSGFSLPEYTQRMEIRRLYTPSRPFTPPPPIPEPYDSFDETFSYSL